MPEQHGAKPKRIHWSRNIYTEASIKRRNSAPFPMRFSARSPPKIGIECRAISLDTFSQALQS